jgi:hypothetical protein
MGRIQGVTNLPPLEISSSRFGCLGVKHEYSHLRKSFPTRFPFLPLYYVPTVSYLTHCLASGWFVSLDSHSDRSYLIYYSDFDHFMSADLSACDVLSWLKYLSFSQDRE